MPKFPPIPTEVKHVAHFLKVADEHDERNLVVSYWCRMHACQVAMKLVPGKKPPEVTALLIAVMDWLEQTKKANQDSDGITNETAGQALIEEYALQLFQYADAQDQAENYGKNVVKAFYTAGILMDILEQFGTLSEDIFNKRKYAKWKAAYIHNCLKTGDTPLPGPRKDRDLLNYTDDEDEDDEPFYTRHPPPNDGGFSEPANLLTPQQFFDLGKSEEETAPTILPPPVEYPPLIYTPVPAPILQPVPAPRVSPVNPQPSTNTGNIGPVQIEKAQKYCKWAGSALTYDDVNTAVDNLQKALHLLQYGEEKQ